MADSKPPLPKSTSPTAAKDAAAAPMGQRKLIRPTLSARTLAEHRNHFPHSNSEALSTRVSRSAAYSEDSHAEAFYFQKQIQAQTRMVVVLQDGEHLEGTLEWYDHYAIKLRNNHRHHTMIYKSGIKYLYKADEKTARSIMQ